MNRMIYVYCNIAMARGAPITSSKRRGSHVQRTNR